MGAPTEMLPGVEDGETTCVISELSAPLSLLVQPVGRWYEAHKYRRHHHHTLSHRESLPSSSDASEDSEEDDFDDENDDAMLLTLDPKEWKDQDHYAILGLKNVRYKASEEHIKKAYKRKVLKHHPDKREPGKTLKPRKEGDDDYFSCITKAYDILGHPTKRRSYDSVDPEFNDDVPSVKDQNKENFYGVFTPAFERNARWSIKRRVAKVGNANSTIDEVERFYKCWYDLNSWREFSYLDEEEKDKGENREERRWIEKQNKVERKRRAKEEVVRLRTLVDNAYACDPRIKKFREDEKEKKIQEKKAKQEAARAAILEREREKQAAIDAERMAKEKEEQEARAKAQAAKREREAVKKVLKKERRKLRDTTKKYDYFTTDESERVKLMVEVEKLCEALSSASLQSLNVEMAKDEEIAKSAFLNQLSEVNEAIEKEKQEEILKHHHAAQGTGGGVKSGGKEKQWNTEDLQILVKAANLFPPGTVKRYEVLANYINQHSTSGVTRNAKDIISKTKELQKNDSSMKDQANQGAFHKFQQSQGQLKKRDLDDPSVRFNNGGKGAKAANVTNTNIMSSDTSGEKMEEKPSAKGAAVSSESTAWTNDEQKRLEQALKTYPASTKDRWDWIAEAVPTRKKKECMIRYKELVERVKAKKAAQAAVTKS